MNDRVQGSTMHLMYDTTICYRRVSAEDGKVTWKRLLTGDDSLHRSRLHECKFFEEDVDFRIAGALNAGVLGGPGSKWVVHQTVALIDDADVPPYLMQTQKGHVRLREPMPYTHRVVNISVYKRSIRCERACAILLKRVSDVRLKPFLGLMASMLWETKASLEWDRE